MLHWTRTVSVALVAVLVVGSLAISASRAVNPPAAFALVDETTVVLLRGEVVLERPGQGTERVLDTAPARVGDRVRTGPDAYAVITYFNGSTTTLEPETEVRILRLDRSSGAEIAFYQEVGLTWNRVETLVTPTGRFEARTPTGVVFVRGTDFAVQVDERRRTRVETVTGRVVVEAMVDGELVAVEVAAGYESTIEPSAAPSAPAPTRRRLSLHLEVAGPAYAFVTDSNRRSVGIHPLVERPVNQIAGARSTVSAAGHQLEVPDPSGAYDLVLRGRGDGGAVEVSVSTGEPATSRSPLGLARAATAEVQRAAIAPGQLLGTTFLVVDGRVVGLPPLRPTGGPPAASRAGFTRDALIQPDVLLPHQPVMAAAGAALPRPPATAGLAGAPPGGEDARGLDTERLPFPGAGAPAADPSQDATRVTDRATPADPVPSGRDALTLDLGGAGHRAGERDAPSDSGRGERSAPPSASATARSSPAPLELLPTDAGVPLTPTPRRGVAASATPRPSAIVPDPAPTSGTVGDPTDDTGAVAPRPLSPSPQPPTTRPPEVTPSAMALPQSSETAVVPAETATTADPDVRPALPTRVSPSVAASATARPTATATRVTPLPVKSPTVNPGVDSAVATAAPVDPNPRPLDVAYAATPTRSPERTPSRPPATPSASPSPTAPVPSATRTPAAPTVKPLATPQRIDLRPPGPHSPP